MVTRQTTTYYPTNARPRPPQPPDHQGPAPPPPPKATQTRMCRNPTTSPSRSPHTAQSPVVTLRRRGSRGGRRTRRGKRGAIGHFRTACTASCKRFRQRRITPKITTCPNMGPPRVFRGPTALSLRHTALANNGRGSKSRGHVGSRKAVVCAPPTTSYTRGDQSPKATPYCLPTYDSSLRPTLSCREGTTSETSSKSVHTLQVAGCTRCIPHIHTQIMHLATS